VGLAVGGLGPHIEPTAVEEDAEAIGCEGTEAAGGVLDGLDFAVEAFGHGVGDGMGKVGKQAAQVIFERAGDAFDRREFAAAGAGIPLVEEGSALVAILLLPEAGEVFLGQPGAGGLQIALRQTLEVRRMFFRQRALAVEPPEAGLLERVVSLRGQLFGFGTAHFIDRLAQQLGNMELVVHQLGLRQFTVHGGGHGRTHVGRGRLDRSSLLVLLFGVAEAVGRSGAKQLAANLAGVV
jgi:nitroreductase